MNLRDIVLAVFVFNFIFALMGFFMSSTTESVMLNGYVLAIDFCTLMLAYWIREDGEKIEHLKEH